MHKKIIEAQRHYQTQNYTECKKALSPLLRKGGLSVPERQAVFTILTAIGMMEEDTQTVKDYAQKLYNLNPNSQTALSGLAGACLVERNYASAAEYYGKLTQLMPQNAEFEARYGIALVRSGQLEKGLSVLENHLDDPESYDIYVNYGLYYYPFTQWEKLFENPTPANATVLQKVNHAMLKTLSAWGVGNKQDFEVRFKAWEEYMAQTEGTEITNTDPRITTQFRKTLMNMKAYHIYLTPLKEFGIPTLNPQLPKLYILGDSHGLAQHGQVIEWANEKHQIDCRLVIGAKLWRLIQPTANPQKFGFFEQLSQLPENAKVIVSLGEIDCREQDGILQAAAKYGKKWQDVLEDTWQTAFDEIKAGQGNKQLSLTGYPRPNPNRLQKLTTPKQQELLECIEAANVKAKQICQQNGWQFIDVFALTKQKPDWFLEDYHLKPGAIAAALAI